MNAGARPPSPIAEGNLERTPLAHVLIQIVHRRLSGTLAIWPEADAGGERPAGQDRILLKAGQPIAARLLEVGVAFDRSLLPLFHRRDAPYAFYQADLIGRGDGLLTGHIEPLALIAASLRGGAREDAIEPVLARFGAAAVTLTSDDDLERMALLDKERSFVVALRSSPGPIEALVAGASDPKMARRLLYLLAINQSLAPWEGKANAAHAATTTARGTDDATENSAAIGGTAGRPSDPNAAVRRPAASGQVAGVVREGGPSDVHDAPPPDGPPEGATAARADSGSRTPAASEARAASSRAAGRPAGPRRSATPVPKKRLSSLPPPPPPELTEQLAYRWRSVAARAAAIEDQNYFDMLGIERSASDQTVNEAYLRLVKEWHPDRLPAELDPVRPYVERIFGYLTRAKNILADPEKRGDYLHSMQEGGGTPAAEREVTSIVQAAMEFQKVEVLVRRKDYDEALAILDEAMTLSANEPDFFAMRSWILLHIHAGRGPEFAQATEAADQALKLYPDNERAHYCRGLIARRNRREDEALRHFKRVVEINPRNIEAMREVRLAMMRGQLPDERSQGGGSGGLLKKLFSNKKR